MQRMPEESSSCQGSFDSIPFRCMPESVDILLERLSNLVRAEERGLGQETGLQPVQLHVLQYLARANRYSDTPAAVAEYLGLTKGTVSQTLITLEKRGLLTRTTDSTDKRVTRLSLTQEGRAVVRRCSPPPALRRAIDELGANVQGQLAGGLTSLLRGVQETVGARGFGVCNSCRHFLTEDRGARCGLTQEPLPARQTEKICREHAPPD